MSPEFDLLRMTLALLKSMTGSVQDLDNLNEAQVQLQRTVENRKFLLVLDDDGCTNYELWHTLITPLMRIEAAGSVIIVTTRSVELEGQVTTMNWRSYPLMIAGPRMHWDPTAA